MTLEKRCSLFINYVSVRLMFAFIVLQSERRCCLVFVGNC